MKRFIKKWSTEIIVGSVIIITSAAGGYFLIQDAKNDPIYQYGITTAPHIFHKKNINSTKTAHIITIKAVDVLSDPLFIPKDTD